MKIHSRTSQRTRGVALIAVLAVLTILALIASAFVMFVALSRDTSKAGMAKVQSDMLANSAVEHAVSLLRQDVREQPRWDDLSEVWNTHFRPGVKGADETVDIDKLPGMKDTVNAEDARWIYVKNQDGLVVGRYAVMVEDESAKINVNAASALAGKNQNQGIDTFEIMLSDGKQSGLPVGNRMAEKILQYRYGKDKQPGQALRDDNVSGAMHATDEIDNDADSIYDEKGEGTDEPQEYIAGQPVWDDRAFSSVDEVADYCSDRPFSAAARRMLRKYGTVHSNNRETFWDTQENNWQKKVNLNIADRHQIHRVLRRANDEIPFEPSAKSIRNLVANLIDYRDENHVLTTMGSDYGVEAVCFNEIMANEASMVFQTDWDASYVADWDPDLHCPTRRFYYAYEIDFPDEWFKVQTFKGGGSSYTLTLKKPKRGGLSNLLSKEPFYDMDLPWEPNFWLGCDGEVRMDGGSTFNFTVTASAAGNARQLTMKPKGSFNINNVTGNMDKAYCRIISRWTSSWQCGEPEAHMKWWFPTGLQSKHNEYYYRAYFINTTLKAGAPGGPTGITKSEVTEFDVDGSTSVYNPTQMDQLKYIYNEGKAMRANEYGYIPILGTSSRKCRGKNSAFPWQNAINFILFSRPDIVELINVSDSPISLRNWSVVVNTGVEALTLDRIDTASHYSLERNGTYNDPNPVIQPGGYFYLTSNREIFDIHYANGDGEYGSSVEENIPVYELTEKSWGITYPIVEVTPPYYIKVDGSDWEENIMKNELMMILTDRTSNRENVPDGLFMTISSNNKNTLRKWAGFQVHDLGVKAGDRVMIFGLPRKGGFVSFTLKNQYGQITARTTTYGTVEEEERGYSTEKADPTHYTWIKNSNPTIGGTERKARNRVTYQASYAQPHIKNNPYTSIGELQKVRRADDWENIGTSKGEKTTRTLKALSRYFTTAGIRLDAEEDEAHISGWKPAFGTAINNGVNSIDVADTDWGPGIWSGQKLTMLSGDLAGEEFVVTNSRKNGLLIDGYSTEKRVQLQVRSGDKFGVGAGYTTPMYYTRKSGEEGIWEWQNKKLEKMSYALYLFGLNDSIKTTEFLEENWNANLDAGIYNYVTREYDTLPLDDGDVSQNSFDKKKGSQKLQFNKTDGIYCGMIKPEHISPKGGIRLKLTAHNLENSDCSGFAWFDFAYLAPAGTAGKININTAPARVISALKNITPKLAENVVKGIDRNGRARLKPYKEAADILEVAGITPDMYGDICNLITTRSDQFRVVAIAQTLEDTDGDGRYTPGKGDRILSESTADVIVDRGELTDGNPDSDKMRVVH